MKQTLQILRLSATHQLYDEASSAMREFDAEAMADVVVLTIKAALAPVLTRIAVLEAKGFPTAIVGEKGERGADGKDAPPVTLEQIRKAILDMPFAIEPDVLEKAVSDYLSAHPPKDGADGRDGKDAEVDLDALAVQAAALVPTPKDGTNGVDGKDGVDGRDGTDAEPVDLDALALKAAELIPVPKDGTSVTVADVTPLIVNEVRSAVAALPVPKDGEPGPPVDPAFVDALVMDHVAHAVAALPAPKDGTSVTVEDVAPFIAQEVEKAVAALPPPKDGEPGPAGPAGHNGTDGRDLTVEDVAPLIAREVAQAVKAIPIPKDGIGVSHTLIDHEGRLVLTFTDGTVQAPGVVKGEDGAPGPAGPPGKDGASGTDGRDGTLENLMVSFDGKRTLTLSFKDGTPLEGGVIKLVGLTRYEGIWSSEKSYEMGDQVTRGGSQWTAKADSLGKQPGTNEGGAFWQLSVKRGDDGKVGPQGPQGKQGLDGKHGIDLRRS